MLKYILIIIAGLLYPMNAQADNPDNSAVVFVYYQIQDNSYDSGGLSPDSFNQHLKLFQNPRYNMVSLDQAIDQLNKDTALPKNSIALTFEGAFRSTYENALKPLIENQIPFTLFFASERIDRNASQYMTWDELRSLQAYPFISFGLLPSDYQYMTSITDKRLKQTINTALSRTESELGIRPRFFAVPYGIYNHEHLEILQQYGFTGIFGQQSGVLHKANARDVIPRFSLTEGYGDPDRIEVIAHSKPLYITDVTPADRHIHMSADDANLTIGFTRDSKYHKADEAIACFGSGIGKLDLHRISDSRFEIRLPTPINTDRLRINCTQSYDRPVPGEKTRSRWYGLLFNITEPEISAEADFFAE